jgi:hypothetical protein
MSKIIEAADLPESEKVYLKKGMLGYRIVHPIKNEDGRINYVNLLVGGWQNLFKLIFIIAAILFFVYIYNHDLSEMRKVYNDPCAACVGGTPRYTQVYPSIPTLNEVINNETSPT